MNKFTPGPWNIRRIGKSRTIVEIGPICVDEYAGSCWIDVSESDASIACAAPDLLEALEGLFADYKALADSGDAGNWALEDITAGKKAMAAIARARGEKNE